MFFAIFALEDVPWVAYGVRVDIIITKQGWPSLFREKRSGARRSTHADFYFLMNGFSRVKRSTIRLFSFRVLE